MSHITIIIGSSGGQNLTAAESRDSVQITYTPPDHMEPRQVGKEVARRLKWLETLPHADAADT
jgi:hypothetical protein